MTGWPCPNPVGNVVGPFQLSSWSVFLSVAVAQRRAAHSRSWIYKEDLLVVNLPETYYRQCSSREDDYGVLPLIKKGKSSIVTRVASRKVMWFSSIHLSFQIYQRRALRHNQKTLSPIPGAFSCTAKDATHRGSNNGHYMYGKWTMQYAYQVLKH